MFFFSFFKVRKKRIYKAPIDDDVRQGWGSTESGLRDRMVRPARIIGFFFYATPTKSGGNSGRRAGFSLSFYRYVNPALYRRNKKGGFSIKTFCIIIIKALVHFLVRISHINWGILKIFLRWRRPIGLYNPFLGVFIKERPCGDPVYIYLRIQKEGFFWETEQAK